MPTPLEALLVAEIDARGPMTFAAYMQRALTDPEHGYYARGRRPGAGTEHDFVTAPEASDVLGRCLGRRLSRCAEMASDWELAELGPGSGALLRATLDAIDPEARPARLHAVDAARDAHGVLAGALDEHAEHLVVHRSVDDLPRFDGVVVANEFLDALPVHLLEWTRDGWSEVVVDAQGGGLVQRLTRPSDAALAWAERFAPEMDVGARYTAMLPMADVLAALGDRLRAGVVVIADYGGETRDRWGHDPDGTVRAFRRHTTVDALTAPGLCDVTSDVDLTALKALARDAGFEVAADLSQAAFLAHLGALTEASLGDAGTRFVTHPGAMGSRFRAVVLDRGGWADALDVAVADDAEVWARLSDARE